MEFTLKTIVNASANSIYSAWLSSEGHTKMTGGDATITNKIGDHFTAWNGYISGKNIALETDKRIMQSWRTTDFKEDENDSQIEILLNEIDGNTEITLIHTNLPDSGEQYINGWDDHYFKPMKSFFSK